MLVYHLKLLTVKIDYTSVWSLLKVDQRWTQESWQINESAVYETEPYWAQYSPNLMK